jgi:hypothetical protein
MFANALTSTETIFSIAYTSVDNAGKFGSIASMLYSDGNSGWGEEFASSSYREELGEHPEDIRWSYIVPLDGYGGIATKRRLKSITSPSSLFRTVTPISHHPSCCGMLKCI